MNLFPWPTLRDLFAVQVLTRRMLAAPDTDASVLAADVYEQADRLVAALREARSPATPRSPNS